MFFIILELLKKMIQWEFQSNLLFAHLFQGHLFMGSINMGNDYREKSLFLNDCCCFTKYVSGVYLYTANKTAPCFATYAYGQQELNCRSPHSHKGSKLQF